MGKGDKSQVRMGMAADYNRKYGFHAPATSKSNVAAPYVKQIQQTNIQPNTAQTNPIGDPKNMIEDRSVTTNTLSPIGDPRNIVEDRSSINPSNTPTSGDPRMMLNYGQS